MSENPEEAKSKCLHEKWYLKRGYSNPCGGDSGGYFYICEACSAQLAFITYSDHTSLAIKSSSSNTNINSPFWRLAFKDGLFTKG
jgi:hypothetical protein